jgi:hypothetical protein
VKRSELVVGAEVAYIRFIQRDNERPIKVTVLSLEPYEQGWDKNPRLVKTGQGVLVQNENGFKTVLALRNLVGAYDVAFANYEAEVKASEVRFEAYKVAQAKSKAYETEVFQPALKEFIQAVKALGTDEGYITDWTRLSEFKVETLNAITEALKGAK